MTSQAVDRGDQMGAAPAGPALPHARAEAGALIPARSLTRADTAWLVGGGVALTACFVLLFWHFFRTQFRFAIEMQADWGHILVIPLISAYFVYLKRDALLATGFRTTWIGLVPVAIGTFAYMFCWLGPEAFRNHNLQAVGVATTLIGVVITITGFRATRHLLFPLAYLIVFGQAVSDGALRPLTTHLQDIAAVGAYWVLLVLGFAVERMGNVLVIFDGGEEKPLNIAEACSGMRMLMAFLALGVFIAYTGLKYFWQRATLVLLALPTAIFVNILRVVTLGWLSLYDTNFAAGDFHHFIGLVWLVPALLIYLGIVWILRNMVIETPENDRAAAAA